MSSPAKTPAAAAAPAAPAAAGAAAAAPAKAESKTVSPLHGFLGGRSRTHLIDSENNKVEVASVQHKVVGLLFSADHEADCRAFKPRLRAVYDELRRANRHIEIVLVSSDRDQKGFNASMADVPWVAIPFTDTEGRESLRARFGITHFPSLIFFDEHGKVSNTHGVVAIAEGAKAYPFRKDPEVERKEAEAFDQGVIELFRAIDLNGDKVVTRAEILKTLSAGNVPGPMIESFAQQIMADVDKDHSASLTLDEWQLYFKSLATKMGGVFPLDGFMKMFGLRGRSRSGTGGSGSGRGSPSPAGATRSIAPAAAAGASGSPSGAAAAAPAKR